MQNLTEVKIIKELFREHQFRFYKGIFEKKRVFVWSVRSPNFAWKSSEKIFQKLVNKSIPNVLTLRSLNSFRGEYRFILDGLRNFYPLKDWLKTKPNYAERLKISSSIVRSVSGLHSNGFSHCWINDDSFFIDDDEVAHMVDFPVKKMYYSSLLNKEKISVKSLFGFPPKTEDDQKVFDVKNIAILVIKILTGSIPPLISGNFSIPKSINRDLLKVLEKILNGEDSKVLSLLPTLIGRLEMISEEEDTLVEGSVFNYFSIFSRKYLEPFSRILLTVASIWASFEVLYLLGFSQIDSRIPNVIGETESIGLSKLQSRGFVINMNGFDIENNMERGLISKTKPKPGASLKKGDVIEVWISPGKLENIVPDFSSFQLKEYFSKLVEMNIWPTEFQTIQSNQFSEGTIASTSPYPGSKIKQGDAFSVSVYFSFETKLSIFPDLKNMNIGNSLEVLKKRDFEITGAVRTKRYLKKENTRQKIMYHFPQNGADLPILINHDLFFIVNEPLDWSFDIRELPAWVNNGGIEIVIKYGSQVEDWEEVITRGLKHPSFENKIKKILNENNTPIFLTISQGGKLAWSSYFE